MSIRGKGKNPPPILLPLSESEVFSIFNLISGGPGL